MAEPPSAAAGSALAPLASSSSPLSDLAAACEACRGCPLGSSRQQAVVGRGNPLAPVMLIGEAPGADEDACGLPFVGRSGRLLDALLSDAGLASDDDLYICNVIKCRPPGNRRPNPQELASCRPWLEQQIRLVDPTVILLAGATALAAVLGIRAGITRLRGQWRMDDSPLLRGRWLMPILHPSYLLRHGSMAPEGPRQLTASDLETVWLWLQQQQPHQQPHQRQLQPLQATSAGSVVLNPG